MRRLQGRSELRGDRANPLQSGAAGPRRKRSHMTRCCEVISATSTQPLREREFTPVRDKTKDLQEGRWKEGDAVGEYAECSARHLVPRFDAAIHERFEDFIDLNRLPPHAVMPSQGVCSECSPMRGGRRSVVHGRLRDLGRVEHEWFAFALSLEGDVESLHEGLEGGRGGALRRARQPREQQRWNERRGGRAELLIAATEALPEHSTEHRPALTDAWTQDGCRESTRHVRLRA